WIFGEWRDSHVRNLPAALRGISNTCPLSAGRTRAGCGANAWRLFPFPSTAFRTDRADQDADRVAKLADTFGAGSGSRLPGMEQQGRQRAEQRQLPASR